MASTQKTCKRCEETFDISEFRYNKPQCYGCQKILAREWKTKNRDRVAEYNKQYKLCHKEDISEYNAVYNVVNRDKIQPRSTANYLKKYHTDFNFKVAHNLRKHLRKILKENKQTKKALELLGCSREFFIKWLQFCFEINMTVENHGKIWHIDHVVPCSVFDLSKEEEIKKCFHWTNMKPMLAAENIKKNNKVCMHDIKQHEDKLKKFTAMTNTENFTIISIDRYSYIKIP
jgi:hypothetical protein